MGHRSAALRALASLWLLPVLAYTPRAAVALTPRNPQVVFSPLALQNYLNDVDGGVNVSTDQADNASLGTWVQTCSWFGLEISSIDTTALYTVGAYATSQASPTLFPLLPSSAKRGSFAECYFSNGTLLTLLYDNMAQLVSMTQYTGVDRDHTGFYIQGSAGTWYTEDWRNGGRPQALAFAATGFSFGKVYLCFEPWPYNAFGSTFTDEILFMEPRCGDPVVRSTWGQLKRLYR